MDWAHVIVIILAIIFAIFLLAGIVLLIMIISVTKQIKHITKSAQDTITVFERSASQAKTMSFLAAFVKRTLLKLKNKKNNGNRGNHG